MNDKSQIEEMKRYVFYEMSPEESDALEEQYFEDSGLFYKLLEFEQDLIDKYAVGKLSDNDLIRFETSLKQSPKRVEKVLEAKALQKVIEKEKTVVTTVIKEETPINTPLSASLGFWEKISALFNISPLTLQFATGALAVLLLCGVGFLVYKNIQERNEQYAEEQRIRREQQLLEEKQRLEQLERDKKLQEQNQQNQTNNNTPLNSNVGFETNANQLSNKDDLQKQIDDQKKKIEDSKRNLPPANSIEVRPSTPTLAFAFSPLISRGGSSGNANGSEEKTGYKIIVTIPPDNNYKSVEITPKGKESISKPVTKGTSAVVFYLPYKPESDTEVDIGVTEKDTRAGSESIGTLTIKVQKNKKP